MKFRFCGDLDCPDWVLAEINTLSKMSSIRLKVLVSQILSNCINGELNYEKVRKLASDNADGVADIKGAIAAIHFIITSAAKYDISDAVLIQEIQQLGLPKENSDTIAKQFRDNKENLRQVLEEKSYRISHFLAADWRVDQVLAVSQNTPEVITASTPSEENQYRITNQKLVHVKVQVNHDLNGTDISKNSNTIESLAFELSPEKLDLLIHELSQAEKLIDDLSS